MIKKLILKAYSNDIFNGGAVVATWLLYGVQTWLSFVFMCLYVAGLIAYNQLKLKNI